MLTIGAAKPMRSTGDTACPRQPPTGLPPSRCASVERYGVICLENLFIKRMSASLSRAHDGQTRDA